MEIAETLRIVHHCQMSVTPMDQAELNNWKAIAERMELNGDTGSWFYLRARAIADGKPDPMPNVSELMPDSV